MTKRGSRQGCRFGSVIFKSVYGVAVFELLENLKDCGAHMLCSSGSRAPTWKHQNSRLCTNQLEPVPGTDVTYVDDEAIFHHKLRQRRTGEQRQTHRQPGGQDHVSTPDPGKTEIVMLWDGKRTRVCKRECNVEGVPGVLLESERVCKFVPKYKHLGSMVSATPLPAPQIRARIKKATCVFDVLAKNSFCNTRSILACATHRHGAPQVGFPALWWSVQWSRQVGSWHGPLLDHSRFQGFITVNTVRLGKLQRSL